MSFEYEDRVADSRQPLRISVFRWWRWWKVRFVLLQLSGWSNLVGESYTIGSAQEITRSFGAGREATDSRQCGCNTVDTSERMMRPGCI